MLRAEFSCDARWTPKCRARTAGILAERFPSWKVHGEPFLSWLWVDCGSVDVAAKAVDLARAAGVPLRWGKYGYKLPQFIRIAVRSDEATDVLFDALKPLMSQN